MKRIFLLLITFSYLHSSAQVTSESEPVVPADILKNESPWQEPRWRFGLGSGIFTTNLNFISLNTFLQYHVNNKLWVEMDAISSFLILDHRYFEDEIPPPYEQYEVKALVHRNIWNATKRKQKKIKSAKELTVMPYSTFRQISIDGGISYFHELEGISFDYADMPLNWVNNQYVNLMAGLTYSWGNNNGLLIGRRLLKGKFTSSLHTYIIYAPWADAELSHFFYDRHPGINLTPAYKRTGFRSGYKMEWRIGNSPVSLFAFGEFILRPRHDLIAGPNKDHGMILNAHGGLVYNLGKVGN